MDINNNISGILAETQKLKNANIEFELALQKLELTQKNMVLGNEKISNAYQDNALKIRKAEAAIKSNNEQIDKNIKMLDMAKGSLEKNKALLELLKAQYIALTNSQDGSTQGASKLNNQITLLSKTVDDQEKKISKSREVFDFHEKSITAVKSAFDGLNKGAGNFAPELSSVANGFNALKTGLEVAQTGFKSVGMAIKATGFGLLMIVLESLSQYFNNDKIGIKRLQGGLAAVQVVVGKINHVFQELGRIIVEALLSPVDTIKTFWNGLINTFGKSFYALGDIITGVFTANPAKVSAGMSTLSREVNAATNNIKKGFKLLKNEVIDTGKEIKNAYNDAYNKAGEKKPAGGSVKRTKRKKQSLRVPPLDNAKNMSYAETLIRDKKQYDTELALLNDLLNKKLISQQQYQTQSRQLQDTFHQNVGSTFQLFAEHQMKDLQKQQRELVELQLKNTISHDEKNAKKAILPAQKLDAEKQLIADKYEYERFLANDNVEKIKEIEAKKQQDLTALTQQYEQQRKEFALNTAQQVSDKAFSIIGNNIKSSSDAKIRGLEKDKASELSNKNLTQTQRKAIEDKYQKKENQEKVKAFKAEQKASVLQAVVNGALAITKATSAKGFGALCYPGHYCFNSAAGSHIWPKTTGVCQRRPLYIRWQGCCAARLQPYR
jgi:hypothetical protein